MKGQGENKFTNMSTEPDPIDRILTSEDPIVPSSGFLTGVMEGIQEASRAPAPIPFPWKRAILAIPLLAGVTGWGAYEFMRGGIPSVPDISMLQVSMAATTSALLHQAEWVALAFMASLLSWKLARRLTGQS